MFAIKPIKCVECDKEIPKRIENCPHCGTPVKRKGCVYFLVAGFISLFVILYFIFLYLRTLAPV